MFTLKISLTNAMCFKLMNLGHMDSTTLVELDKSKTFHLTPVAITVFFVQIITYVHTVPTRNGLHLADWADNIEIHHSPASQTTLTGASFFTV